VKIVEIAGMGGDAQAVEQPAQGRSQAGGLLSEEPPDGRPADPVEAPNLKGKIATGFPALRASTIMEMLSPVTTKPSAKARRPW
jgi:hypothetical protein